MHRTRKPKNEEKKKRKMFFFWFIQLFDSTLMLIHFNISEIISDWWTKWNISHMRKYLKWWMNNTIILYSKVLTTSLFFLFRFTSKCRFYYFSLFHFIVERQQSKYKMNHSSKNIADALVYIKRIIFKMCIIC